MEAVDTDEIRDENTLGQDPLAAMDIDVTTGDEEGGIENDFGPEGDVPDGDMGDGNGEDSDLFPGRGRPRNKADSPFINIIPFAKFALSADLFWLSASYWKAHDEGGEVTEDPKRAVDLLSRTAEDQGDLITRYLKAVALEHLLADDDRERTGQPRQYAQEMHFVPSVKELVRKEMQAEAERISQDVRRTLADRLRKQDVEERIVDLVLLGGEDLG